MIAAPPPMVDVPYFLASTLYIAAPAFPFIRIVCCLLIFRLFGNQSQHEIPFTVKIILTQNALEAQNQ